MAEEEVRADLASAGAHVRAGTGADAVGGHVPAWVAAPPDEDACAAVVAAAARHGLALTARGNGTKIGWGAPPRACDLVVDTAALDRIEHAAGDLIVTAGAGAPLSALAAVLGAAGQRLTADDVVPGGTVGGLVATGLSGPGRMLYGRVRDLVIGMTAVRADGVVARTGGRVVKNVAGYDLAKLYTGALGTLGVITSVTFRLRPVPAAVRLVSAPAADAAEARARTAAVLRSTTAPTAVELDAPPDGPITLHVLLEGPEAGVGTRADEVAALLGAKDTAMEPPADWGALPGDASSPNGQGVVLLKATTPPADLQAAFESLTTAARDSGVAPHIRGSAGSGVLYLAIPAGAPTASAASFIAAARPALTSATHGHGSLTVLKADPELHRHGADYWGDIPGLPLMRAVKDAFDPEHRLSPGRYAGGI